MQLNNLIAIGKAYQSLGTATQEQLDSLLAGEGEGCNPNALRLADDFLRKVARMASAQRWDEEAGQDLVDEVTEAREEINSLIARARKIRNDD